MNLSLDLQGLDKLRYRTQAMIDRLNDLSPVWESAHDLFRVELYGQFETEGQQILGQGWAPLSPDYAKDKPEPPTPFGILYRTGKMFRSLVEADHPNHVFIPTPSDVTIGTTVTSDKGEPYPVFHQKGAVRNFTRKDGSSGTAVLPPRPIIGFRNTFKQALTRIMLTYVLSGRTPDLGEAEEIAYRWR